MNVTYANLLLVSHDPLRQAQVAEALNQLGLYDVTLTTDLSQAAQMIGVQTFDIMLLDAGFEECADAEILDSLTGEVPVPLIIFGDPENLILINECIEQGAADYFLLPISSNLLKVRIQSHLQKKRLQEQAISALHAFNEVEKLADDLRMVILPLSVALSAEKNFYRLVERFVLTAMDLCHADSGTLFMRTPDDELRYAVLRVRSLGLAFGGTKDEVVPHNNLPLFDEAGRPVLENVATFAAHEGISINIADVHDGSGFDFSGTREFDRKNNYRTTSCLTVPLINHEVTGVLQLRNAQNPETGQVVSFGPYQQLVTESLASQVAVALHNRRLRKREASLLRYKKELEIGREIQAGFFPASLPQPPGWQLTARFQPAREVAGDFYDAFPAPMSRIGMIIADVCDKGVVAALFMALLRSLLRAFILQHYTVKTGNPMQEVEPQPNKEDRWHLGQPSWPRPFYPSDKAALLDTIRLTNAYIGSHHANIHIFATLFVCVLDPVTGRLIYVNSGHVPPLIVDKNGQERRLMPSGPAIGLLPNAHFTVEEVYLQRDDTLLAYTDGISEARNSERELFGADPLVSLMTQHSSEPVERLADAIESAVEEHTGSKIPADDVTFFILRRSDEVDQ